MKTRRPSSFWRLGDRAFIAYLRYRLKPEWQSIALALDQEK
ncbi:hypothetical protein N5J76_17135 [Pseudomonas sp. GD03855]|jgi:hypothetical protein|nr:hypothetical protein [Stutzerimonas kunmingensis]MDH2248309.1 hypothetical protein [Pseudomonas sp. GD03856]MDH2266631.1 hypothetical protein [Pseudomonas sp. GD03855]